jgi:hypothetical protein
VRTSAATHRLEEPSRHGGSRVPPPLGEGVATCFKSRSLAQSGPTLNHDSDSTHITMRDGIDPGAVAARQRAHAVILLGSAFWHILCGKLSMLMTLSRIFGTSAAIQTALRRSEALCLRREDIDPATRKVIASKAHENYSTKNAGISFYDDEAAEYLSGYLAQRTDRDERLFAVNADYLRKHFKKANPTIPPTNDDDADWSKSAGGPYTRAHALSSVSVP